MPGKSGWTVLVAFGADAGVSLAKIGAGFLGGSSVMWAEAGHAVSDTMNQVFLYTALRRSNKGPTRQHPLGFGRERFFWALIAAVGIFVAGAGFSLYEGIRAFTEPNTADTKTFVLNYAVFGIALVLDGASAVRGYRQTYQEARARGRTIAQHIKLSPEPSVKTVVSEDTVAVIGNVLGLTATALQQVTRQPLWDGVAALMIMSMLIFVAFALAHDNKDLLIGEAVQPEEERQIAGYLEQHSDVKKLSDVFTIRLGAESTLVAARLDFGDDISGLRAKDVCQRVEQDLRDHFPDIERVFLTVD